MESILPVERRGCGYRKAGAAYCVVGVGPYGLPPERFIVDPPVPLPDGFPVAIQGMNPFWETRPDGSRVMHLVDRLGTGYYPTPAHFYAEYSRLGVSRLIPRNSDFGNLTRDSRLLVVHEFGYLLNHADYAPTRVQPCPTHQATHTPAECLANGGPMCAGLWWENMYEGMAWENSDTSVAPMPKAHILGLSADQLDADGRRVVVSFNESRFMAYKTPPGVQPDYHPAICFKFPIRTIEVVDGGHADETYEKARRAAANGITVQKVEY